MLQALIDELLRIRDAVRLASQLPHALNGDAHVAQELRSLAHADYEKSESFATEFALARATVEHLQSELSLLEDAERKAQEQLEQLQIKVNLDYVPEPTQAALACAASNQSERQAQLSVPAPKFPVAHAEQMPLRTATPMVAAPAVLHGCGATLSSPLATGHPKRVPTKPSAHPEAKMKVRR